MKSLNPTNSSFEVLRTSGAVYVDKTGQLQDMISLDGGYFFLARPRRFGKTLAVSTLESIFRNRRDLFKGLHIYAGGCE